MQEHDQIEGSKDLCLLQISTWQAMVLQTFYKIDGKFVVEDPQVVYTDIYFHFAL